MLCTNRKSFWSDYVTVLKQMWLWCMEWKSLITISSVNWRRVNFWKYYFVKIQVKMKVIFRNWWKLRTQIVKCQICKRSTSYKAMTVWKLKMKIFFWFQKILGGNILKNVFKINFRLHLWGMNFVWKLYDELKSENCYIFRLLNKLAGVRIDDIYSEKIVID